LVKRVLVLLILFVVNLSALSLDNKIESFLGKDEFHIQKNLIDIIFHNQQAYYKEDGSIDDLKVLMQLKENGLLKLFYDSPKDMTLSFKTDANPLVLMRVINESLEAMGYSYFITDKVIKNTNEFIWNVKLSTEHVVDPILLAKELHARGCETKEIKKYENYNWSYVIDTKSINIKAEKYETNTTIKLKKPIKPYWIDIEEAKSLSLRSKIADRWYPSIIFYDKSLNVLQFYKKDEVVDAVKIDIPKNAKYVKIGDIYTLDNIKRGLSLYLVSK